MQKFEPKMHNMPWKKIAQIRDKKAPNTTLKKLLRGKKMQKLEPKMHNMPWKKIAQIRAKKAPNTTLQKLYAKKKNA